MELEGVRTAIGFRMAIVVARFNEAITEGLLAGAKAVMVEAGIQEEDVLVVHVPGAFEIPLVAQRLAETGRYAAIVCLGCVIKGDTMHFEYIAGAATDGIARAATVTGVPMTFGVLTTLTEQQAVARSVPGPENKGREAALAAVEMATLLRALEAGFRA